MRPEKLTLDKILAVAVACGVGVDPAPSDTPFVIETAIGPIALSVEEIVPFLFGEEDNPEGCDDADRS